MIYTCGPTPMMKAVARYAQEKGIECEASLENLMACGLGACLCCVEKTVDGNLCVCKQASYIHQSYKHKIHLAFFAILVYNAIVV